MIVQTQPGCARLVASAAGAVALVETTEGKALFNELTDEQLLAIVPGPAALVHYAPGRTELVLP
jgi:hypothetical protein